MQTGKLFLLLTWLLFFQPSLLFAQFQQTSGPEGGVINAMINHNGTLLAGSGGAGIFRSADGGNSWVLSNTGLQNLIIFTFAGKDTVVFAGSAQGLYKSTDDGVTWSPDGLTIGVVSLAICGNYLFAGTAANGIYRSDLNGNNWVVKNTGLANLDVMCMACYDSLLYIATENGIFMSAVWGNSWTAAGFPNLVNSLAVNQSTVFAGTGGGGIYKSPAGSTAWTYSGTGMAWNEAITAIKVNGGVMYAASAFNGVYRSDDNGNTWTMHNAGLTVSYVRSLECLGTAPLAGTNGGGVFSFDNAGNTWIPKNSGIINTRATALMTQGPEIYCGTCYSGIFATNDNGNTWNSRSTGLPQAPVNALLQSGQNLYCGLGSGSGIYKSADQGQTWSHSGLARNIYALSELPGKLLAGAGDGIYCSTDNGISWLASNSGLPSSPQVFSLLPAGTDLFAGLYNNGVYFSSDNGSSWAARNNGIAGLTVYALAKNDSSLFAGTYGGIYRSMDDGAHWNAVNYGLWSLWVNTLANTANGLLAGTFNGLFLSKNNGNYWADVSDGLADKDINSVAVSGDTVFAGTNNNGVWSNLLSVLSGVQETGNPAGILVYPNPAHDRVTVSSSGPGFPSDRVRIYDLLGNVVGSADPGTVCRYGLNISALPRGLYILVVKCAGMDRQMKLLVE
ncbi:MAG: T9SS type A sorting domain-containing protein [Bacteroidota bacterium]